MCLIKSSIFPRVAIKDIIVYKGIMEQGRGYITPWKNHPIVIGEIQKPSRSLMDIISDLFYKEINGGYIHSFTDLGRCRRYFYGWGRIVYVKCLIPRGTLYWTGDIEDIASRKLKYLEIIN